MTDNVVQKFYLEDYGRFFGGVPEWSKGTDCKSVGDAFGGSNPPPTTKSIDCGFM